MPSVDNFPSYWSAWRQRRGILRIYLINLSFFYCAHFGDGDSFIVSERTMCKNKSSVPEETDTFISQSDLGENVISKLSKNITLVYWRSMFLFFFSIWKDSWCVTPFWRSGICYFLPSQSFGKIQKKCYYYCHIEKMINNRLYTDQPQQ